MSEQYHYCPRVFSHGCFAELSLFAGVAASMTLWTLAIDGWAWITCALTFGMVIAFGWWR